MSQDLLFTSESVSEGHPDKVADQISDAVLDAILKQDIHARVACETMVKTGMALVAGEISTTAWIDIEELVREVILNIGYNDAEMGFDGNHVLLQPRDKHMGVRRSRGRRAATPTPTPASTTGPSPRYPSKQLA